MTDYDTAAAALAAAFPAPNTPANKAEWDLMVRGRAVVDVGAVLAENERLRAFAAEQNDQLLEANAEIERLRTEILTLRAEVVDARGKARNWKAEYDDIRNRLEIVKKAAIKAGLSDTLRSTLAALVAELDGDATASRYGLHGNAVVEDDYFRALVYVADRLRGILLADIQRGIVPVAEFRAMMQGDTGQTI